MSQTSLLESLPDELLLEIISIEPEIEDLHALTLVCHSINRIATAVLYRSITVPYWKAHHSYLRFVRTLIQRPDLVERTQTLSVTSPENSFSPIDYFFPRVFSGLLDFDMLSPELFPVMELLGFPTPYTEAGNQNALHYEQGIMALVLTKFPRVTCLEVAERVSSPDFCFHKFTFLQLCHPPIARRLPKFQLMIENLRFLTLRASDHGYRGYIHVTERDLVRVFLLPSLERFECYNFYNRNTQPHGVSEKKEETEPLVWPIGTSPIAELVLDNNVFVARLLSNIFKACRELRYLAYEPLTYLVTQQWHVGTTSNLAELLKPQRANLRKMELWIDEWRRYDSFPLGSFRDFACLTDVTMPFLREAFYQPTPLSAANATETTAAPSTTTGASSDATTNPANAASSGSGNGSDNASDNNTTSSSSSASETPATTTTPTPTTTTTVVGSEGTSAAASASASTSATTTAAAAAAEAAPVTTTALRGDKLPACLQRLTLFDLSSDFPWGKLAGLAEGAPRAWYPGLTEVHIEQELFDDDDYAVFEYARERFEVVDIILTHRVSLHFVIFVSAPALNCFVVSLFTLIL